MKTWSEICEKASIVGTSPYQADSQAIKADRVKVTVDIPIEYYQDFRAHIEVPSLRGRRDTDKS